MRATEFITELFQPGKKNWDWMYRGSQEAVAEFTVGNREYRWQAFNSSANPLKWEIQFRLIRKDTDPEELDLFGKTGTGNSTEVLSIAVDITRAFLQEYGLERIEELTFNAKEDSRVGLYAKMINRLLPDWDLRSKPDILNGGMIFYLTDRRAYDKPENKISEEQINEAYSLEWDDQFGPKEIHARAYDRQGQYIDINFVPVRDNVTDIEFSKMDSYDETGQGDEHAIFATVLNAVKKYLQGYQPKIIVFSGKGDKRGNLYQRMIARYAGQLGYRQFDLNKLSPEARQQIAANDSNAFVLRKVSQPTQDVVDEMALKQFTPMGDFEKPGPFRGVDKRLVPHPTNQLKTQKFFEKTPYDFRLFFSNIPGTGRYSEYGPMQPQVLQQVFGDQAQQIIQGSEDAITVVFVGNKGDSKVMMTPWIMAHRFGHAIQAGHRNIGASRSGAWPEAEQYFFNTVNQLLERCYGKIAKDQYGRPARSGMSSNLTPEYNALFNAIGTQRSSRSNEIKRPYEFLYELFAQYLGTGTITLNPLPTNLGYGRKAWGTPSKYLNLKPEFRDEEVRQYESQGIGDDLTEYFAEVLRGCIGNIYVM